MSEPSSRAASPVTRYSRVSRSSTEAMAAARSTRLRSRAEVTRARDRSRLRSAAIASARARAVTSVVVSLAMISTRVGRPLGWGRREKVMEKKRGWPGSHQSRDASSTDTVWPVSATWSSRSRKPAGPASGNTAATGMPTIASSGRSPLATSLASSRIRSGARATATASGLRSTRAVTRSRSSRSSRRIVSSRPTSRKLTQAPSRPSSRRSGPPAQRAHRSAPSGPANQYSTVVEALAGQGQGHRPALGRDRLAGGVPDLEPALEALPGLGHLSGVVVAPDADGLGVGVEEAPRGVHHDHALGQLAEDMAQVGPGRPGHAGRAGRGQVGAWIHGRSLPDRPAASNAWGRRHSR